MALEKVLALDATGVIEKLIDVWGVVTEHAVDCNSLTSGGAYNVTTAAANRPAGGGFFIEVFPRLTGQILQVAYPNSETNYTNVAALVPRYSRWFDGIAWSTWKEDLSKGSYGIGTAISIANCNDFTGHFGVADNTTLNTPVVGTWYSIFVPVGGIQIAVQLWQLTPVMFIRVLDLPGTTWGVWTQIHFNPKITVGTTAPASPSVGDLWVDTN